MASLETQYRNYMEQNPQSEITFEQWKKLLGDSIEKGMEEQMNLNEIKKSLYKINPKASLIKIKKGHLHYESIVDGSVVVFQVPYSEITDGTFETEMDAKHLIKWITA